MSVMMTLRVTGDGNKLEATADRDLIKSVADKAQKFGVLYQRFYASDTEILVVDEWPDEASFQSFFEASPEIRDIMAAAGVTTHPEVTFWRNMDLGDNVG